MNLLARLFGRGRKHQDAASTQKEEPPSSPKINLVAIPETVEWQTALAAEPALAQQWVSLTHSERGSVIFPLTRGENDPEDRRLIPLFREVKRVYDQVQQWLEALEPELLAKWRGLDDGTRRKLLVVIKLGGATDTGSGVTAELFQRFVSVWPAATPRQEEKQENRKSGLPGLASVSHSDASMLRENILAHHPLTKCCELSPTQADDTTADTLKEVGLGATEDTGLLRIVLYRLDGHPINDETLQTVVLSFLNQRAARDLRYMKVLNQYVQSAGFRCPRVGFSIHLKGSSEEIIAQCEVLATTEYAETGSEFTTTGHGFTANGTPYRIYFYWSS